MSSGEGKRDEELRQVRALVREHLLWEERLGTSGLAQWDGVPFVEGAVSESESVAESESVTESVSETASETATETATETESVTASVTVSATETETATETASVSVTETETETETEPETAAVAGAAAETATASGSPEVRLAVLQEQASGCTACRLHEGRTHSVFARGSHRARLVFVGEGPGFHEDKQGVPFVGNAGQLLDKMITAMGLSTESGVYICNVVKCRPPDNRTPLPDEADACRRFLEPQLDAVGPEVIVALGRCAAESLGCAEPARSWRGIWGTYRGVPVMPTYHPAYLLRSPDMKRPVWEDLQKVMERLGLEAPKKRR